MTRLDVWAPLGAAGTAEVVDALTHLQFQGTPATAPHVHRCDLDVAGHHVDVHWRLGRVLACSVAGAEVASGKAEGVRTGQDTFVWDYTVMPLSVLGETVEVTRERSGRDRWAFRVAGPQDRTWRWRPAGALIADRMELTRDGDRSPVVTHTLRPVPGHPRSPSGPPTVTWQESASLVEVLMPVLWVLDQVHKGLLPKAQRIARLEFL
ncbi:hypothetical protein [Cellulomonas sp. Leaf334]|uniref:hypothetical protein n=1 Tax=Cellulomonas sp. Leaf334 TaxID=1736339 RepID=UPI0006FDA94F|nr:hypothetical protein [Cellulomonas sp. Leaf334]KQR08279.1 hypothetical protein ASF78_18440 [Cellulomonas sp. Leaf334]